jgi:hypothetical protein
LRSSNFWILPVLVLGSSPKTTARGTLKPARCWLAVGDDGLCRDRGGAGLQFHKRARRLAPLGVGLGHHRGGQHVGVAVQHVLHLDGRDVFAARNDDVLAAVLDLDVAVGVLHGQVAGVEPAAGKGLLVALGFFR